MSSHPNKSSVHAQKQLLELQGEVHALQGMLAVLIAHVALLSRVPISRRDEILSSMNSMLPSALAQIERDRSSDEAAGFERAVEAVTSLARNAIQIEPVVPPQHGDPSR